jgi:hypothetical protein
MNFDIIIQVLRYAVLFGGGIAIGAGWATKEQIASLQEALPEIIGALSAAGTVIWGVYVKWNTKAVPASVAAKPTVPTVSTVTGKTEK